MRFLNRRVKCSMDSKPAWMAMSATGRVLGLGQLDGLFVALKQAGKKQHPQRVHHQVPVGVVVEYLDGVLGKGGHKAYVPGVQVQLPSILGTISLFS